MFQLAVDSMGDSLTSFEDAPGTYNGRVNRLDGGVPDHPKLEKAAEIQLIVMGIKNLLLTNIFKGYQRLDGSDFIYSLVCGRTR